MLLHEVVFLHVMRQHVIYFIAREIIEFYENVSEIIYMTSRLKKVNMVLSLTLISENSTPTLMYAMSSSASHFWQSLRKGEIPP